jgi:hypothetical protein
MIREPVQMPEDHRGRRYVELVDQEIQYGVRRGSEFVMDRNRRAGRVMRLGRGPHHQLGMGIQDVEPTGDLDQSGPDGTVAYANG